MDRKINFLCLVIIFLSLSLNRLSSGSLNQGQYLGLKTERIEPMSGGIIPHHLLAGHLIDDFFRSLSIQNPTTIILLGPNHDEKGDFKVLTSLINWETDFGVVNPSRELIQKFIKLNFVRVDEEVVTNEHSISGIVPFIKNYLPESKIFPLVLSASMSREEIEFLARNLSDVIDKETVVVVAVDFSHGLKVNDAYGNDSETLEMIKEFNYPELLPLGNEYLDSPPAIALLLAIMEERGHIDLEILAHTSSAELYGNTFAETTSYFSIAFY